MNILQYLFILIVYAIYYCGCEEISYSTITKKSCSAMDSYLRIAFGGNDFTVLSTQALFPPNAYYIPPTSIVTLSDQDIPCDKITTDITNKMVLLLHTSTCSDHYQTYLAQQNGATAVLISSNGNTQSSIPGSTALNTSIPVRGIAKGVADVIITQTLDTDSDITGSFDCDSTEHPLTICAVDTVGDQWYLDGDYIRQINETYNDHPIWLKKGYYLLSYYIFLHTANRSSEWFWAITTDRSFESDRGIRAYCSVGGDGVKEPSDCPLWRTSNLSNSGYLDLYNMNKNLTISAHICIYPDKYICVESTQSSLGGLQGTYRLNHNNVPLWFREIDECDSTPGILGQDDDMLVIQDPEDGWTMASCNGWMTEDIALAPQTCTLWKTLDDYSLDKEDMSHDPTLTFNEGKCGGTIQCDITERASDTLCLSNNSVLHSYLEGTYIKTGVTGDNANSVEYMKKEIVYKENGEPIKLYLWYYGEFSEFYPWWILSPQNLSWAKPLDGYGVIYYGYVACSVQNVANCNAPWHFYWDVTRSAHSDASFEVSQGDCQVTTTPSPPEYGDEYDYICIDIDPFYQFESETKLDRDQFVGGYKKVFGSVFGSDPSIPYWAKPVNDYTDTPTYIWYDKIRHRWHIDTLLYNTTSRPGSQGMVCMSAVLYPEECENWYDTVDGSRLNSILKLRVNSCSFDDVLTRRCSAMHSWLQLSGYIDATITSSQTLFAPYFYRISATELVRLDPLSDDPCDIGSITSDVSGKMVLLFTTEMCSDHYQLYVMQELGATSAIMSGRDNSISAIKEDDEAMDTVIPMRGISLIKAIEIATVLDSGQSVYGSFDCDDTFLYPLTICAANIGLSIYGNFEYQIHVSYNDHPIWIREGYSYYTGYQDTYLFLHNDWYWAITMDSELSDDDSIIAYCSVSSYASPMDCGEWMVDDQVSDMITYSSLCNVTDNYLCITSQQSSLAGLGGTYRLYTYDEPVWFRERDECDSSPAIFAFSFEDRMFYVLDPLDDWIVASCYIGDRLPWLDSQEWQEYEQHYAFHPELCTVWYTLDDAVLNDYQSYDDTLYISAQTTCFNQECIDTAAPNNLCLLQNSIMHSFLEGEYIKTGVVGDVYQTAEYIRSEELVYDGNTLNVYLWFYGEVPDKTQWWIISNHNMSTGLQQGYAIAFGYVACRLNNVANCAGNWNFYYGTKPGKGEWHSDTQFNMIDGHCTEQEPFTPNYTDNYQYLCIDIIDESYYNGSMNIFKGGYKINKTSTSFSGDTPYWIKPPNDYYKYDMYIYYDEFYGYWQIGNALHIDYSFICMDDTPYPQQCDKWYDEKNTLMNYKLSLRIDECSAKDILGITVKKKNGAIIAVVVILIIVVILISVYCIYHKLKDNNNNNISSTEMRKKRGHTQLAIGSDEDGDDGALTKATPIGGYDMNPLPRDDDDHDEEDQQENDINDDEDEDGVLMTKKY